MLVRRTWFTKGVALILAVATAAVITAAAAPQPAQAYYSTTNWYSKTWWFNKHETWEIGWGSQSPSVEIIDILREGPPSPLKAALAVYGYSFKWIAQQARSRNACIAITWIYVNLPYPWIYRGSGCYDS